MRMLDLFSGIGGFHKGFEEAGWEFDWVGYSEIDEYASAVYRHKYPGAIEFGDIKSIQPERDLPDKLTVLCGGFPCQSFSIAGKRDIRDARGTLFFEIARILSYYRDKGDPVPYFLLENVKGLYSHDDYTTFAKIYGVLADLDYNVECSLENTKYYLPQNRERVYIAGYLGDRGRGQIFPISRADREDKELEQPAEPNGQNCKTITARGAGEYHSGMQLVEIIDKKGNKKNNQEYASALCGGAHSGGNHSDMDLLQIADFRTDEGLRIRKDNVSPCLNSVKASETEPSWMPPLTMKYGIKQLDETLEQNDLGRDDVKMLDLYNRSVGDISPTLTDPKHNNVRLYDKSSIRRLTPNECERLQGFSTRDGNGEWNDGWTSEGIMDGVVVEMSDTQRYKMCGNAVTVPVVKAIAEKILKTKVCDHSETEYQFGEFETGVQEGLVCVLCGEDLELEDNDWDGEAKELRL